MSDMLDPLGLSSEVAPTAPSAYQPDLLDRLVEEIEHLSQMLFILEAAREVLGNDCPADLITQVSADISRLTEMVHVLEQATEVTALYAVGWNLPKRVSATGIYAKLKAKKARLAPKDLEELAAGVPVRKLVELWNKHHPANPISQERGKGRSQYWVD